MRTNEGALAWDSGKPMADVVRQRDTTVRSTEPRKRTRRAPPVLYMLTPQRRMSPFDINMAADAGYKLITSFDGVSVSEVAGLVQDAMFSRPPADCARTAVFIGGKDITIALEMMSAAKAAMFSPFEISVFADPGGSFTTAAAMVACAERRLKKNYRRDLKGIRLAVFGASGVVGFASAVLAAQQGAKVAMVGHESLEPVAALARMARESFGADLEAVLGATAAAKSAIVSASDVVFTAGPAGVPILTRKQIARADRLLIAADVNAVAPAGIEGMEAHMDGAPLPGSSALGVGPLAIGDVKYKTQALLLKRMLKSPTALHLDFRDAFDVARGLTQPAARRSKA